MMGAICIKNYPSNAPDFLGEDLARKTPYSKSGYTRNYIRNGEAMLGMGAVCDDMSALNYCYSTIPLSLGRTGVRSFSGIAAGRIFVDPSGAEIACPVPGTTPSLE